MPEQNLPDHAADADLVTFDAPPVNEVVLSVQFENPVVDDALALAEFWPEVRSDLPRFEKQPPILPSREEFGVPPAEQTIELPLFSEKPIQRYWFLSEDETRIVQVQPDRFIVNWRQVRPGDTYPRYRELRADFRRLYDVLLSKLPDQRRDEVQPALCELSYINHVEARSSDHAEYHAPLSGILRLAGSVDETVFGPPEDTQLQQRYRLMDPAGSGEPVGRLYISATPGFRKADEAPIYALTLLARARPQEGTPEGIVGFFDYVRNLIVREFVSVTTEDMHREWRMRGHGPD